MTLSAIITASSSMAIAVEVVINSVNDENNSCNSRVKIYSLVMSQRSIVIGEIALVMMMMIVV